MNTDNSFFLKVTKAGFVIALALLPLLFLPAIGVDATVFKKLSLTLLLCVSAVSFFIHLAKNDSQHSVRGFGLYVLALLPITFLVASIAKGQSLLSIFGYGFEITTVSALILLSGIALLSWALSNKATTKLFSKVFLVSFAIFTIYQLLRLFVGENMLSFNQFAGTHGTLIGKWNDVAIISGLVFFASYLFMKGASQKKLYLPIALFVISGFLLKVVSFGLMWIVLGGIFLLYVILDAKQDGVLLPLKKETFTKHRALGLFLGSAFLLFALLSNIASTPNSLGNPKHPTLYKIVYFTPNLFGGTPIEVRPSLGATFSIYKKELQESPLFGTGSNRFTEAWAKYRDPAFVQTPYWNTNFLYGIGYLPTLAIEGGMLGTLVVLVFLGYVLLSLYKVLRKNELSPLEKSIVYGTLLLTLFATVYIITLPLLALMFAGIGFVLSKNTEHLTRQFPKRKSMYLAALFTFILFGAIFFQNIKTVLATRNYALASYAIANDKNIDTADSYMKKALAYSQFDTFKRAYADLLQLKTQVIVAQGKNQDGTLSEQNKTAAVQIYKEGEGYAEQAIATYPTNYLNYLYAGSIYAGDPDTLVKAVDMYNKSLTYNPNNPEAYFGIAKVYATQNNIDGVKENLQKALQIRSAYTPALLAGAQLSALGRDATSTLEFLTKAYQSDTSRVDILLQIADIEYTTLKDIKTATQVLEYAVGMYPNYADARLALSNLYAKQGNFEDAANLLVGIKTNDEQTQSKLSELIAALRSKKDPFGGVAPQTKTASSTKAVTATTTKTKK